MTKYRKKPVEIEATQWFKNGDHPLDYVVNSEELVNGEIEVIAAENRRAQGWEGDLVRRYRHPEDDGQRRCEKCGNIMHDHGWIDTFEGGHIVCPGDWIITGVEGEHYPCKPSVFAATYDLAEGE